MSNSMIKAGIFKHINCRNNIYPKSNIKRFPVPDEFVFWTTLYAIYAPTEYTSDHIHGQTWADPDIDDKNFRPKWNQLDDTSSVNRKSYNGIYQIENGRPINPIGRTGLRGRGLLGRWGPNHAADPIVTRWKRNTQDVIRHDISKKPILQFIAIKRRDNNMWAIPGGMVDPGEVVSTTLKREFIEEALDGKSKENLDKFFANGREVYKGYVDDFRNTDNAWIETVACNFHDETGTEVGNLILSAGDDAINVKWVDLDSSLQLHANHIDIIKEVVKHRKAHW